MGVNKFQGKNYIHREILFSDALDFELTYSYGQYIEFLAIN